MASKKRPYDEIASSDDDEEPSMGRQTLPVARLPADFNEEPMDGMQYLFMVRRAAEKLPFTTRVANPYQAAPVKAAAVKPEDNASSLPKSTSKLPSEEWKETFLKRFKNFRKNTVQPTIGAQIPFIPSQGHSKFMPGWTERDNWLAYINGRPEYEWDPPKPLKNKMRVWNPDVQKYRRSDDLQQYEVSYSNIQEGSVELDNVASPSSETLIVTEYDGILEEGEFEASVDVKDEEAVEALAGHLPTPSTTPQPELRPRVSQHRPPTMTHLREIDHRYSLRLLQFFTHWINRYLDAPNTMNQSHNQGLVPKYITQNHARWIFSLLTRLDDRLLGDELNELRNLARAIIRYLKDIKEGSGGHTDEIGAVSVGTNWVGDVGDAPMDQAACWMIVTAVANFWGQKDLWMDAEVALR